MYVGFTSSLYRIGKGNFNGANARFHDLDALGVIRYGTIKDRADIVFDMRTTFYGMREFGIRDGNGYVVVFAQRVQTTDD